MLTLGFDADADRAAEMTHFLYVVTIDFVVLNVICILQDYKELEWPNVET